MHTDGMDSEEQAMTDRMLGFIFPNTPMDEQQDTAFRRAVLYQLEHERTAAQAGEERIPGAKSVRIGHFSVSFSDEAARLSDRLTRDTICNAAYAVLLRAGLLYRGVER